MWDQRAANAKKTKRPADAADDGSAGGRNAKPAATDVRIDPITGELRQPVDLKPRVAPKKMPRNRAASASPGPAASASTGPPTAVPQDPELWRSVKSVPPSERDVLR